MSETKLNRDEVAKLAYEIYLSRGGEHGRDQEDWLLAERELRGRKPRSESGGKRSARR